MTATRVVDLASKVGVPLLLALLTPLLIGAWHSKADRSELTATRDSLRYEARLQIVRDSAWKAQTTMTLQEILANTKK